MALPVKNKRVASRFNGLSYIQSPLKAKTKKYAWIHQGKGINVLACLCQSAVKSCINAGEGGFDIKDVKVTFDSNNIYLDGRTQQVLYYIIQLFTDKVGKKPSEETILANRNIVLSVSDVAELFNMTYQGAWKMLDKAIDTLYYVSVAWKQTYEIYKGKNKKMPVEKKVKLRFLTRIESISVEDNDSDTKLSSRGCFIVRLEEDFARYLPSASTMWYPLALYRVVPVRMTCAFAFGIRLALQYRYAKYKKNKFLANFIRVEVLVFSSTELPNHEYFKDKGEMSRKIILPFIRGLDSLVSVGVLETWCFIDSANGKEVPLEVIRKIRYKQFVRLYVYFKLVDYPGKEDFDYDESVAMWLENLGTSEIDTITKADSVPIKNDGISAGFVGVQPSLFGYGN